VGGAGTFGAGGEAAREGAAREPVPDHRGAPLTSPERGQRLWGRRKEWSDVATRHERTVRSVMGVLCPAAQQRAS
jgi:hypothetical protein